MEHVNVTVPDQALATQFYVVGLGFTRDPYLMVGLDNMWVNMGEQQFHLPTRGTQVIPGHIGLVVKDLEALKQRLQMVEPQLAGTKFAWSVEKGYVAVTCPWGNQFRCYAPQPSYGDMAIGIPYVEFLVRPGTAEGIARFYQQVMKSPATVKRDGDVALARVEVGSVQAIYFRETTEPLPEYDGHHIAVYVADFSSSYNFFAERNLIMEDIRNHQYRFKEIIDPESGEQMHVLEHEVRSVKHPMFGREMVNRNPAQSLRSYHRGQDALLPAI
ncbi:MAG TPA: hypothetical protein VHL09_17065 [Dehalococcoidia bacterium]|nr:hypothetical protein [Dehalococcoidia bacterium]